MASKLKTKDANEKGNKARRKKTTAKQDKPKTSEEVQNCTAKRAVTPTLPPVLSASKFNPDQYMDGMMFVCTKETYKECMELSLFGLPQEYMSQVKTLQPKTSALFLFNMTDRRLHGIFEASRAGAEDIDPHAWARNKRYSWSSPFPAQIEFRLAEKCEPLNDADFRHMFNDRQRIRKLGKHEVGKLIRIFLRGPGSDREPQKSSMSADTKAAKKTGKEPVAKETKGDKAKPTAAAVGPIAAAVAKASPNTKPAFAWTSQAPKLSWAALADAGAAAKTIVATVPVPSSVQIILPEAVASQQVNALAASTSLLSLGSSSESPQSGNDSPRDVRSNGSGRSSSASSVADPSLVDPYQVTQQSYTAPFPTAMPRLPISFAAATGGHTVGTTHAPELQAHSPQLTTVWNEVANGWSRPVSPLGLAVPPLPSTSNSSVWDSHYQDDPHYLEQTMYHQRFEEQRQRAYDDAPGGGFDYPTTPPHDPTVWGQGTAAVAPLPTYDYGYDYRLQAQGAAQPLNPQLHGYYTNQTSGLPFSSAPSLGVAVADPNAWDQSEGYSGYDQSTTSYPGFDYGVAGHAAPRVFSAQLSDSHRAWGDGPSPVTHAKKVVLADEAAPAPVRDAVSLTSAGWEHTHMYPTGVTPSTCAQDFYDTTWGNGPLAGLSYSGKGRYPSSGDKRARFDKVSW